MYLFSRESLKRLLLFSSNRGQGNIGFVWRLLADRYPSDFNRLCGGLFKYERREDCLQGVQRREVPTNTGRGLILR